MPTQRADDPAQGVRASPKARSRTDAGRTLGTALANRAEECCDLCAARASGFRWEGSAPSAEYIERVRRINWLATVLVARWLAYRIPVAKEEMAFISDRGDMAAAEQQSIVNLTRAYLIWRDTVAEVLQEEASRLKTPSALLAHALYIVRVSCDASLIQVARTFDASIRRLTEDLKSEREMLLHLALHDPLTGLPNRVLLYDRINQTVLAARRHKTTFALLAIDLDGVKSVNDNFGHRSGDVVLQQISARLVASVRESDTVARWGGDEFTVLLVGVARDVARGMARQLERTICEPLDLDGVPVSVGATIGVATYPSEGDDVHTLLSAADHAMYEFKRERTR